jgi:hypothetical protein
LGKKNHLNLDNEMESYLAKSCSYLPFFIDRIITPMKLSFNDHTINQTDIDKTIEIFITGRENNHQFNHFTERIDAYYDLHNKRIAHELLRILCKNNEPILSETLLNSIKTKIEADDFEIFKILSDLYEDMYVDRDTDDTAVYYRFRYPLLKKWWRLNFA